MLFPILFFVSHFARFTLHYWPSNMNGGLCIALQLSMTVCTLLELIVSHVKPIPTGWAPGFHK